MKFNYQTIGLNNDGNMVFCGFDEGTVYDEIVNGEFASTNLSNCTGLSELIKGKYWVTIRDYKRFMKIIAQAHVDEIASRNCLDEVVNGFDFKGFEICADGSVNYNSLIIKVDVDFKKLEEICFKENATLFDEFLHESFSDSSPLYLSSMTAPEADLFTFYMNYRSRDGKYSARKNAMIEFYLLYISGTNFGYVQDEVYAKAPSELQDEIILTDYSENYEIVYEEDEYGDVVINKGEKIA